MASKLSGTSKATFAFVKGSLGPLAVASVLPAVFMTIVGVANVLVTLDPETGQPLSSEKMTLPTTLASLALGLAALFFYCWMVVKICRMYLDSEPPSLIGSGGSLKAGFWVTLYYIAAMLVILIPMIVASIVVFFVLFGALGDQANDMIANFILPGSIKLKSTALESTVRF